MTEPLTSFGNKLNDLDLDSSSLTKRDSSLYGNTKDAHETKIKEISDYLDKLISSNTIETINNEKELHKWFIENVTRPTPYYDRETEPIMSRYNTLKTSFDNQLKKLINKGGSKRGKSTRIYRKSIRKCNKCKRNYRKSKKSKQV
jgi:hypothetical protein